jgi:hypothetical protein
MTTQNVETQSIYLKASTYPIAYSDAKNVFNVPCLFDRNEIKIEDIKI